MPVAECAFRTGRSGYKDKFEGMARHTVGLPLPAISQVTAVDDQFGTHTSRTSATISPSATLTLSGTASAVAAASIVW
jgi:hypothetical protein